MKRIASFVAGISLLFAEQVGGQTLRVAYSDLELVPYQMGMGTTIPKPAGAMLDLLNQATQDLGLVVVYERSPQLRNLKRLQSGDVDATFMLSFEPGRLEYGQYPMKDGKPNEAAFLVHQSYVFYRLKGSAFEWDGHAVSGLGDGAVGFNHAFSVGAELAKLGVKTEYVKTTEQNFKKLALRRIAAYAMQEYAADSYLARHPMPGVEKLPLPFETKAYYLMLSHQWVARNPALAERLWARVAKLRQEKMTDYMKPYVRRSD